MLSTKDFKIIKSQQYCDNTDCPCYNLVGAENIRIHSRPKGQVYCKACKNMWVVTKGTFRFGLKTSIKKVIRTLLLMANGTGLRKACRQQGITPDTAKSWIEKAAADVAGFSKYMKEEMQLEENQIDKFWKYINAKKKEKHI